MRYWQGKKNVKTYPRTRFSTLGLRAEVQASLPATFHAATSVMSSAEESEKQIQEQWGSSRDEVSCRRGCRCELLEPTEPTCQRSGFEEGNRERWGSLRDEEVFGLGECCGRTVLELFVFV